MTRPPYEIMETRNVSTGVAKRVNVSLIVPPGADLEAIDRGHSCRDSPRHDTRPAPGGCLA